MSVRARLYLVRHGETDANKNGIIQGQTDTQLNNVGIGQAVLVAEALRSIPFDKAYTSDLARASATADAILKHHPDVQLKKQDALRERYMGDMEGKAFKPHVMKLVAAADSTVEDSTSFADRTLTWWDTTMKYIASLPPKNDLYNILAVTHGGVIGTMVRNLIQGRHVRCAQGVVILRCANTSITVIEVDGSRQGILVKYSDISHMKEGRGTIDTNADEIEIK